MNAVVNTPVAIVTQADLERWYKLQQQLEQIKAEEMELRKKLFAYHFTAPTEGVNTLPLTGGWVMKGDYKINRGIDVPLLTTHMADLTKKKIPIDKLIKYKPELVTAEYRKLDEKQRKEFDKVLDIKVGSPSLSIVMPKRQAATPVA